MKILSKKTARKNYFRPFDKLKHLTYFLFFCGSVTMWGQKLVQVELNYQKLIENVQTELAKLDSLNTVHNKMILIIDNAKQKESANENKIKKMLASAVVVSNQIKDHQNNLEKIETDLEELKVNLYKIYTVRIDSLNNLENSNTNSSDKETLKSLKLKYIEKRLIVAPKIYSLSFDPKKLIQFKQTSGEDLLIGKIYLEYLNNALGEVNQQSQQLALLKSEIEEVVNLQIETNDFIEDVDSEIMFNPALQTSPTLEKNDGVYFGGTPNRIDNELSNIYTQANSYLHIFNQLKTSTNIEIQSPWQTPIDTIPANLSFQQYLDLLENVDKMLKDYRTILEHKLESN